MMHSESVNYQVQQWYKELMYFNELKKISVEYFNNLLCVLEFKKWTC